MKRHLHGLHAECITGHQPAGLSDNRRKADIITKYQSLFCFLGHQHGGLLTAFLGGFYAVTPGICQFDLDCYQKPSCITKEEVGYILAVVSDCTIAASVNGRRCYWAHLGGQCTDTIPVRVPTDVCNLGQERFIPLTLPDHSLSLRDASRRGPRQKRPWRILLLASSPWLQEWSFNIHHEDQMPDRTAYKPYNRFLN